MLLGPGAIPAGSVNRARRRRRRQGRCEITALESRIELDAKALRAILLLEELLLEVCNFRRELGDPVVLALARQRGAIPITHSPSCEAYGFELVVGHGHGLFIGGRLAGLLCPQHHLLEKLFSRLS